MLSSRIAAMALVFAGVPLHTVGRAHPPASLAAPEIIIFHGGPLAQPVIVASWHDNHKLLMARGPHEPTTSGRRAPIDRPVIELALFWGAWWGTYSSSPERLAMLRPGMANQRGRYYPAVRGERAMISVGSMRGPVSDSGLAVLRRHRVPTSTHE
jgi:hypothetical protein